MRVLVWALLLPLCGVAAPVPAQTVDGPVAPDQQFDVVILDTERMFAESRYAERLRAEIEADAAILKAENDDLVAQLTAEEQSLTERRPAMDPVAFRQEAVEFDQRVQQIRVERDSKEAELQGRRVELRVRFFNEVRPIVGQLMVQRGAIAVVDTRSVVVARRAADITEAAVAMIDETLAPETKD